MDWWQSFRNFFSKNPEPPSAHHLGVLSLGELGTALARIPPGGTAYITYEDAEHLTGQEWDEFAVTGRQSIKAQALGFDVDDRAGERRIYFRKT